MRIPSLDKFFMKEPPFRKWILEKNEFNEILGRNSHTFFKVPLTKSFYFGGAHEGDFIIFNKNDDGGYLYIIQADCFTKVNSYVKTMERCDGIPTSYYYCDELLCLTAKQVWEVNKGDYAFPKITTLGCCDDESMCIDCGECGFAYGLHEKDYDMSGNVIRRGHILDDATFVNNWWSIDDVLSVMSPKSLKDVDPKKSNYHLLIECKIKHISRPKKNSKFKRYEQKVHLYSDDSRKDIESLILGDEVFFEDEFESGDSVVVFGNLFPTHDIPFQIHKIKLIKKGDKKKSRNQENPEYEKWRNSVVDRDKVCQCCGDADNLQAHHYFGYANNESLQVDVGNGVALCKWCHGKYHSKYGYGERVNPATFNEFVKNHREGFR